jgi:4'-phosphopantetheinyl transferase
VTTVIHPVVMPVSQFGRELAGKRKVTYLSALARRALACSATKSGVVPGRLDKDERGAPLPFEGTHWSISHKDTYVAGVVAPGPVGIDIEKLRPCSEALFQKTGTDEEWELGGDPKNDHLFFRYWTAKETVLKTTGAGFREFSECSVVRIVDERALVLFYRGREWLVSQFFFNGHVAAVVKEAWEVCWEIEDSAEC